MSVKLVHLFKDDPRLPIVHGRPVRLALCGAVIRQEVDVSVWEKEWKWCERCQRIQNARAGLA